MINIIFKRLRGLHYESTKQLKDLLRQQLTLQEDIKVKENTIYIGQLYLYRADFQLLFHSDQVCCMADRESIKLQAF